MAADLPIRVQPHAPRTEVAGERNGRVVVRVTAPPEGGKANDAVRSLLARKLGVAKSGVTIGRGHGGRDKLVRIEGTTFAEARRALGLEPAGDP